MTKGIVKHWNVNSAYGFIRIIGDNLGEEIFFHLHESFYKDIKEGDNVTFDVVKSKNKPGSLTAVNVQKII